ncbi:MAG: hypothetical protein ACI8XZ_002412 [Gammaproteobacteria bacterium]|jgi:hypothetical protein
MYSTFSEPYRDLINDATPVEEAVRKMSSLPAHRDWLLADITIAVPAEHRTKANYYNPFVAATGVYVAIVNEEIAIEDRQPTGVRAG